MIPASLPHPIWEESSAGTWDPHCRYLVTGIYSAGERPGTLILRLPRLTHLLMECGEASLDDMFLQKSIVSLIVGLLGLS